MSNEQLEVGQIYKTDDNVMFVVRDKPPGVMKISDELFAVKIEDDAQLVGE